MQDLFNRLNDYTLLFVENEIGIRENFSEYFNLIFKKVYVACDGIEALELYKKEKPDLIITDIKMPNMDGIELVKKIRENDTKTHIAIISAHTDVEFLLSSIPLGLIEYVIKPLNEQKLKDVFKKFLQLQQNIYKYIKEQNEIHFNNQIFQLTHKENIFLEKLIYGNRVIGYDEIEQDIWEEKEMSQNALRVFIKKLRTKLPEGFIQNVTNQGYKLGI